MVYLTANLAVLTVLQSACTYLRRFMPACQIGKTLDGILLFHICGCQCDSKKDHFFETLIDAQDKIIISVLVRNVFISH